MTELKSITTLGLNLNMMINLTLMIDGVTQTMFCEIEMDGIGMVVNIVPIDTDIELTSQQIDVICCKLNKHVFIEL